ncbi:MAG: hypothetical protein IJV11_12545 [Muribaculaceae bacterium]|nr:hypothetical protein [Muribaculaceae bacterium]
MECFFNTAGPNIPEDNYTIDPLTRFDLDDILTLIRQKRYFVFHAPHQTGKTSCLLALRDYLNAKGDYICVYANVEGGQASRNNVENVIVSTIDTIVREARLIIKDIDMRAIRDVIQREGIDSRLSSFLSRLSESLPKPLILFLDEIDALVGDSLVSVLRQIRAGYANRPKSFPSSIVLCGVRDVRDYRIVQSNQDIITGGSAFNIKAESLRLGNFSKEEIHELYMQHTRETGQVFEEECFPMIWEATEGQPWLVNALGQEVTYEMKENRDRSVRITPEMIYRAQEQIIYRRDTHIDILIDKLKEPRVKRVIEALLFQRNNPTAWSIPRDDIEYVIDYGLLTKEIGKDLRISNSIYREIINAEFAR